MSYSFTLPTLSWLLSNTSISSRRNSLMLMTMSLMLAIVAVLLSASFEALLREIQQPGDQHLVDGMYEAIVRRQVGSRDGSAIDLDGLRDGHRQGSAHHIAIRIAGGGVGIAHVI